MALYRRGHWWSRRGAGWTSDHVPHYRRIGSVGSFLTKGNRAEFTKQQMTDAIHECMTALGAA